MCIKINENPIHNFSNCFSRESLFFYCFLHHCAAKKEIRADSWERGLGGALSFPGTLHEATFSMFKDKGENHKLMFCLVASGSTFIVLSARPSNPCLRLTRIEPSNHFDRATDSSNQVFREKFVWRNFSSLSDFFSPFRKLRVGLQGYFCKTYVFDAFLSSFCDRAVIPCRKIVRVLSVGCAKLPVSPPLVASRDFHSSARESPNW